MNRSFACLLLMCSVVGFAQQAPAIKSGSTVYIEPADGYGTALAAAFVKKQVPLILTTDKSKADYIITSTLSQIDTLNVSMSVVDTHSSQVVFAYSVGGKVRTNDQVQSTAEACAKNLKEFMLKPKK